MSAKIGAMTARMSSIGRRDLGQEGRCLLPYPAGIMGSMPGMYAGRNEKSTLQNEINRYINETNEQRRNHAGHFRDRRRHQWRQRGARRGGAGFLGGPGGDERPRLRHVLGRHQAHPWRAALSRTLRIPPG